jgi:hypothetical protein
MGADKNSSRRRWKLQQGEHGFQHTSPTHYSNLPSPRSHWSATGPRNQHTTFRPENSAEHQTTSPLTNAGQTGEHHRSNRCLLVKHGDFHSKTPHQSDRCSTPVRPVSARKPQNTKQANRAPNRPKLETAATQDNSEHTQTSTRAKNPKGVAPARPVRGTGQTGVTWASRDEQHPRVNTSKSKP